MKSYVEIYTHTSLAKRQLELHFGWKRCQVNDNLQLKYKCLEKNSIAPKTDSALHTKFSTRKANRRPFSFFPKKIRSEVREVWITR